MFDDKNVQPTPAPDNLPTDQPAPEQAPVAPAKQEATDETVQDIFASVDSPEPNPPSGQLNTPQPFMPAGLPVSASPVSQATPKSNSGAKVVLIILIILIIIGAGALVYLQYFKNNQLSPTTTVPDNEINLVIPDDQPATTTDIDLEPDNEVIDEEVDSNLISDNSEIINNPDIIDDTIDNPDLINDEMPVVIDDSLSEIDPNLDSDGDGLTDYEEIHIYGTNPLVTDTDGDGYPDGEEVRAGYNPLGEGRLVQ